MRIHLSLVGMPLLFVHVFASVSRRQPVCTILLALQLALRAITGISLDTTIISKNCLWHAFHEIRNTRAVRDSSETRYIYIYIYHFHRHRQQFPTSLFSRSRYLSVAGNRIFSENRSTRKVQGHCETVHAVWLQRVRTNVTTDSKICVCSTHV